MTLKSLLSSENGSTEVWIAEAHGFLFLASVDGVGSQSRNAPKEDIFGDGPAQAGVAYGEIVRRLLMVDLNGSAAVRIEHATASQDWRLQRMALWPRYFGEPTTAVSQGYQGKMVRQNMITVAAIATRSNILRKVVTPGPNSGRASRVTAAGDLIFVIGVRGEALLNGGAEVGDGLQEHFSSHVERSLQNILHHLVSAGLDASSLLRLDAFIRSPQDSKILRKAFDSFFPDVSERPSLAVVACPLGGRTDIEVSAIASATQVVRRVFEHDGSHSSSVANEQFIFVGNLLSLFCESIDSPPPSIADQVHLGMSRLLQEAEHYGLNLKSIVRLDVYTASQYDYDSIRAQLHREFPEIGAAIVWHGVDLPKGLFVDFSAIIARG